MHAGIADGFGDFRASLPAQVVLNALPIGPVGLHAFTLGANVDRAMERGDLGECMVK